MKEFIVTEEILKFFDGKKVTISNVAKAVPNFRDYALELKEKRIQYSPTASNAAETFGYFINDKNFMSKKEFLDKIQDIFKDMNDDIQFCFNGEYLLDCANYYIQTFEEVPVKENDTLVLNKISDKIRKAIKDNKEKPVSDDILNNIASNPELMKKLNEMFQTQNQKGTKVTK